jgi:AcrR family transcriptional regulator
MESPDARAQAAYGMLKHMLQNHITTDAMPLSLALTGCAMLLTSACLALYDTEEDMQAHVPYTMTRLKERLRARHATPPLRSFATAPSQTGDEALFSEDARALGRSLALCIQDAVDEYALAPGAAWEIALALTADVLAMLLHEGQQTLGDVDALIDESLQPTMLRQMGPLPPHGGEADLP